MLLLLGMTKPTLHFQRFEFKYFLPRHRVRALLAAVLPHMEWDPFVKASGKGFYKVNSLYWDTANFDCFWDKEAGVADRKKLRLRYYEDSLRPGSALFAEIKRKKDALIIKDRLSIPLAVSHPLRLPKYLASVSAPSAEDEFRRELRWFLSRNALRPKIFVSYARRALLAKRDKEFRITIDENITARRQRGLLESRGGGLGQKIYPQGAVFEVKYHNVLPAWFHRVLQKFELQRLAFSKYANSVRHLIPLFDDNNYQPI